MTLADRADSDIAAILRHYEIDQGRFVTDLNRALEKLKTGNGRAPSLAPDIEGARELPVFSFSNARLRSVTKRPISIS